MPKFTVLKTVDAFVRYTTQVEAPDAEWAAKFAYAETVPLEWKQDSVSEYDACSVVTLDANGDVIPTTEQGRLNLY